MNDDFDNARTDREMLERLQATEAEQIRLVADGEPEGCFFIPARPWKDTGKWVPSWVRRNEPGHTPFAGNGPCAQPWFWGDSYQQAQEIATAENEKLGISPAQAAAIILSSVRASRHAGTPGDFTGRDAFGPKVPPVAVDEELLTARAVRRAELHAMNMDQLRERLAELGGELPPDSFRSKTSLVGRIMLIEFLPKVP